MQEVRAHGRFLLLQNPHFHRPWWSDGRRYDSREGGVRAASGTAAENNAGAIVESDAGGQSREDPVVIEKRLTHLNEKAPSAEATPLPESRAPPQSGLFD